MVKRLLKWSRVGMLAGILTAFCGTAFAHDPGLSAAEVRVFSDRIVAEVSFAPGDVANIQPAGASLLTIHADNRPLGLRSLSVKPSDPNSVHFLLEFAYSKAGELRISAPVLASLPRGHKQFCSVFDADTVLAEGLLSADASDLTVNLHASADGNQQGTPAGYKQATSAGSNSISRFLLLGVEHILTGYDHLAFLLALLLAGGSLRHNAKTITSFTVAHSLTLALAATGVLNIPPAIVEPVIAASIVFVGLENLFRRRIAERWVVTFVFGLIHGLGFASALRELGIGGFGVGVVIPLFSFNLGVELAQITIAALVLPLIWRLEKRPTFTLRHVPALSLLITFAGVYWLLTRTIF
jgi:hydrogenase/urease accessory protein HupE